MFATVTDRNQQLLRAWQGRDLDAFNGAWLVVYGYVAANARFS